MLANLRQRYVLGIKARTAGTPTILLQEVGVNAFSIISYVASFAMSVMYGTAEGLQPLFGQSYGAKDDKELKYYFRSGMLLTLAGSIIIFLATLFFGGPISALFGADADVLAFTVKYMPQYSWGFMVAGLNTLMTAYLYSTKRSSQALVVNILRSFVLNTLIVLGLPAIFFGSIIWHTFGIFESVLLIITISVVRFSERNGIPWFPVAFTVPPSTVMVPVVCS